MSGEGFGTMAGDMLSEGFGTTDVDALGESFRRLIGTCQKIASQ